MGTNESMIIAGRMMRAERAAAKATSMPKKPLSEAERQTFEECEKTITAKLDAFCEVGAALWTVKSRLLYREDYRNFDEYCQKRWGLGARRARQLITASKVVQDGKNFSYPAPRKESHATELHRVPEEARKSVWEDVLRTSNGKPTARKVREAARRYLDQRQEATQPEEPKAAVAVVPPAAPSVVIAPEPASAAPSDPPPIKQKDPPQPLRQGPPLEKHVAEVKGEIPRHGTTERREFIDSCLDLWLGFLREHPHVTEATLEKWIRDALIQLHHSNVNQGGE
jgi:hypothetical protein